MINWTPFHFDSNTAWGTIDSPEAWAKLLDDYGAKGGLRPDEAVTRALAATLAPGEGVDTTATLPRFGYRTEHVGGTTTLRQWAEGNGMIGLLVVAAKEQNP